MMTEDRQRLVFGVHSFEQFVFLIADDAPMTAPPARPLRALRSTEAELDDILRQGEGVRGAGRPRRHHRQAAVDDHGDARDHGIYVRYLLPMMVEVQWWEYVQDGAYDGNTREPALRFGAFVPQGWKLEYTGLGRRRRVGAHRRARRSDRRALGYDHLWVYDHVETVPRREPTHVFEAFTTLAALAQVTRPCQLGQLVTCASYRNAGLLAKEAACVDVFSGGRLILGLGAGWYEREYQAYGYEYLSDRERLRVLDETLEVVKRLWTEETVTFEGKHLHFDGAYCDPKPIQQLPPIWVGGGGEKVTLRIAARARRRDELAGRPRRVRAQVARCCASTATRSGATSTRSCAPTGPTAGSSTPRPTCDALARLARRRSPLGRGPRPRATSADNFVGTVEQVAEKVQGFRRRGCRRVRALVPRLPGSECLERFMAEVVPLVQS